MSEERTGIITLKGNPMTLVGPEVTVGSNAPDFTVLDNGLAPVTLADSAGKVRLILSVPSFDTPVCETEARTFSERAGDLPDSVEVLFVSVDLPFGQKRFCTAAGIDKIQTLSDHRDTDFGSNWGVLIKELRLLARAVFVVDADDKVTYVELVSEVADEPDYDKAIQAATDAVG